MLSVAEDHLRLLNPSAKLEVFGQELNDETYAVRKNSVCPVVANRSSAILCHRRSTAAASMKRALRLASRLRFNPQVLLRPLVK
jgi:hypothetical protein